MPQPTAIWTDAHGRGRNRYALFRRGFELTGEPACGRLQVFADTRYRLAVNGHVLAHGPARFFPGRPEYDTIDVWPALRRGRNAIAITVSSAGAVTFHSEASVGGLIAWGSVSDADGNTVKLATDESWRAIDSPGHRSATHYLSFALNPAEHLDARALPIGWQEPDFDDSQWPHAVAHGRPGHWGALEPRSIPLLDEREVRPRRRLGAWVARDDPAEEVHSLIAVAQGGRSLHTDSRVAVLTHLHSPRDQAVTFGAWWGRYWMNGQPLEPIARDDVAMRQDFAATLREGWNTLFVYETVKRDWWDFYLALPKAAGLRIAAERDLGSPHAFLIGGPWEDELADAADALDRPLAAAADLPDPLGPWRPWPRGERAESPHRERAWKAFQPINADAALDVDVPALAERVGDDTLVLLFDFGCEVLGRPVVELTAAAGTVVDLTYSERRRPDGTADVHRRYFVDMAERYVARAGRQAWQTFHPRGFRYLELLIRGDLAALQLHRVALTRANYPVHSVGSFECSDPLLNRIWTLGRDTLHACMEDAYLDCPWRERGLYSGDFFVQFHSNLAAYGDTALFRRCIQLFFDAQGENGLVRPCPHGLPPGRHPDYSAILVQCLWQYYARTGDLEFLRHAADPLERLIAGLDALGVPGLGLIDGTALCPYVDRSRVERAGLSCALNAFYCRALHDGARILAVIGREQAAADCRRRAAAVAQAIRREFWDGERGVYVDLRRTGAAPCGPSVAANALVLLYGIAEPHQVPTVLEWVADAMRHNAHDADGERWGSYNVSAYFSFYALGALYEHGRAAEAEAFVRTEWGRMLDAGAWTCWEHFADSGSRCHAWSSAPTYYLSSRVLGVQQPEPGAPNRVHLAPSPGTLQWAAGVWPHPAGPVRIAWQRVAGKLLLDYSAPDTLHVTTDPGLIVR